MSKLPRNVKPKQLKHIPNFKNEDEERNFWDTHDTSEYFDLEHPVELDLSQLKPSTETISLRLPPSLTTKGHEQRSSKRPVVKKI